MEKRRRKVEKESGGRKGEKGSGGRKGERVLFDMYNEQYSFS